RLAVPRASAAATALPQVVRRPRLPGLGVPAGDRGPGAASRPPARPAGRGQRRDPAGAGLTRGGEDPAVRRAEGCGRPARTTGIRAAHPAVAGEINSGGATPRIAALSNTCTARD